MKFRSFFMMIISFMMLAGCSAIKQINKAEIDAGLDLPQSFDISTGSGQTADRWWLVFNDTALNGLMDAMLENNKQIAGSYEGLKALQAALGITSADKMPSLTAGASAGEKYATNTKGEREWNDTYELSLTASYEVDIWGRISAAAEADRMSLLAGRYDLETLYMTLTAELADRYYLYRSLTEIEKLQAEMLLLREKQLSALEMMYASGVGSLDEIYVKQTAIANLMEDMTETRKSIKEAKYQLALLSGFGDPEKVSAGEGGLPSVPPLPLVIPSDVASKRPDIMSAYATVLSVNADVAQAMANRYPKLSFSASAAYSSDQLSDLISADNFIANLVANLTAPLFDAGKLKNQQKKQEYLLSQSIYTYYQAVLEALSEVSVALADNVQSEQALKLSGHKVSIEKKRVQVAEMKYEMGIKSYADVLDNKVSLLSGELTAVSAKRTLLSSRIELARVSGGSWAGGIVKDKMKSLPDIQEIIK